MKYLASFSLAAAALLAAAPALAGPAGHGQTFTEEVARKRTISIETACAAPAADALSQRADITRAKAGDGVVHVTFASPKAAKSQADAVRAAVSDLCRAS